MKNRYLLPSEEEDQAIYKAIAQDPDTREVSEEEFKQMKRYRGRPLSLVTKEKTTLRLDPDIIAAFKQSGQGWQTRINLALRDWLKTHR